MKKYKSACKTSVEVGEIFGFTGMYIRKLIKQFEIDVPKTHNEYQFTDEHIKQLVAGLKAKQEARVAKENARFAAVMKGSGLHNENK